jgi:hypothetical protein
MHEHLIEAPRGGSPIIAEPQSTVMAYRTAGVHCRSIVLHGLGRRRPAGHGMIKLLTERTGHEAITCWCDCRIKIGWYTTLAGCLLSLGR